MTLITSKYNRMTEDLLEGDESGGVGGSDTGPSVFDRLEYKTDLEDGTFEVFSITL